jgi:hypothetical protein
MLTVCPACTTKLFAICLPTPGVPRYAHTGLLQVFRSYEFTPSADEEQRAERLALHTGSSKHKLWQAVRASSAAPYYLDDFTLGEERFIDGAVSVNNPSVVAIQEARMLYPDLNIDCFVSLGVGIVDFEPRARGMSTYFETGSAVIEGASSTSRPHEALSCMLGMADCVYERCAMTHVCSLCACKAIALSSTSEAGSAVCMCCRFCPMDARCGIPLDCTDEKLIKSLVQATEEYIEANSERLQRVCDVLLQGFQEREVRPLHVPYQLPPCWSSISTCI